MLLKYTKIKWNLKICSVAKATAESSPPSSFPLVLNCCKSISLVPKGEQYLRNYSKTINQESWFVHIFFFSFHSWGKPPTEKVIPWKGFNKMNENIFISLMDYFSVAQFQSTALEKKCVCVCMCVCVCV